MKRFFQRFFIKDDPRRSVATLYGVVMAGARNPKFFERFALPDSFETRFELLALHMFLIMNRLKPEGREGHRLMRNLTEYMVDDLDRTLREAGIGDVGVAKRMKKLISGFYGRVTAYDKALANKDEKEILRALDRNLFAELDTDVPNLEAMRGYMLAQRQELLSQPLTAFNEGAVQLAAARL
jgi:cytochrome b pre-mRNA-processing protein 3